MNMEWIDAYDRGYKMGAGDWFLYGVIIGALGAVALGILAYIILGIS